MRSNYHRVKELAEKAYAGLLQGHPCKVTMCKPGDYWETEVWIPPFPIVSEGKTPEESLKAMEATLLGLMQESS